MHGAPAADDTQADFELPPPVYDDEADAAPPASSSQQGGMDFLTAHQDPDGAYVALRY